MVMLLRNEEIKELPFSIRKTVVVGSSGFLGKAFLLAHRRIHPDCIGTAKIASTDNISQLDLLYPDIVPLRLAQTGHKEALILAGVTKIEKCESEKELTRKINVEGTLELIRQLVSEGIKPIFFSSDHVFDGNRGNYADNAPVSPITEYGRQKAEIEAKIGEISKGNFLVLRLGKVFSLVKGDGALLDEMAGTLVESDKLLRVAYDQFLCPILVTDLIKAVASLQAQQITGIVNVCSPEIWSRYDLALEIAKALRVDPARICRISLDELGFGVKRPKNTSMQIKRLLREVNFSNFTPISKCIEQVAENWRREYLGK